MGESPFDQHRGDGVIDTSVYDATALRTLEGLEPVRARPGMYIGSTDERGLAHLVYELIDNATDEALAGYANQMSIVLHQDGSIEVTDNGRGIPIDKEPTSGLTGIELVMTRLHAGGKFHTDVYKVSGGLHGVGASVVNALSTKMVVEVTKQGALWRMEFINGVAGALQKVKKAPASKSGTSVRFWPDMSVFGDAVINTEWILERCRSRAYLIPKFKVTFSDLRVSPPIHEEWYSKLGLPEYITALCNNPICAPILIDGEYPYEAQSRTTDETGAIRTELVPRVCAVQAVLQWGSGWDSLTQSWVNIIPTPQGGSHINGLWQAITKVVNDYVKTIKGPRGKNISLSADDIQEGLVVLLQLRLPEPQFEGQTKEKLGTKAAHSATYKVIADGLADWLQSRGARTQVKAVVNKILAANQARLASQSERQLARQQSAIATASLPDKLSDCRQHYPKDSELLIVEGKSAAGPCKAGRDSLFQAVLPLRGKIINAGKYGLRAVMDNEEVVALFTSLGLNRGAALSETLRYNRVVLMTDADVDGSHIRCLLLTLLYHYGRPLLEEGRVFYARPPLFTLRVRGKPDQYAHTVTQKDQLIAASPSVQYQVLRFKGLGEMDVDELSTTCLNPRTRVITRVTVDEAKRSERILGVLMGPSVGPRRDYILKRAHTLDYGMLDI